MFDFEKADRLSATETSKLYSDFSNYKLPSIYAKFSFGNTKFVRAKGAYLFGEDGKKIFDFTGGLGVANFGHNPDSIMKVRKKFAAQDRVEIHKSYLNRFLAAASYNLAEILPGDLTYSFFCNSGAEAVDGALKLAYRYHRAQRKKVLRSERSFHGKTIGAGSLSSGDNFVAGKARFSFQKIDGVLTYTYNDIESLEQLIAENKDDIYALFLEPFSCSTLTEASEAFLQRARQLCDTHNILLVFDEIYSGFAKCGPNFYMEKYGIIPDIVCLSKALGAGKSSISAYVARPSVFRQAYGSTDGALLHSTTYNSFGEECVTAMEACRLLKSEKLSERSVALEKVLRSELEAIKADYADLVSEVRGSGSHFGLSFKSALVNLKPILELVPVPFVQDPNFVNKLITTAVIDQFFLKSDALCAFTANGTVFMNFSPSPVAPVADVQEKLRAFRSVLDMGLTSCLLKFINRNLAFK